MLIPATLSEMEKELKRGNTADWKEETLDWYHQKKTIKGAVRNAVNWMGGNISSSSDENVKYTAPDGREVVYNRKTKKVVTSELLGTQNFVPQYRLYTKEHERLDMDTHDKDDKYKYVGILYETDSENPDQYHIVDGQTGRRMTKRQAEEFPTTLTDMWKDMGLVCVPEDATDLVPPVSESKNDGQKETASLPVNEPPVAAAEVQPVAAETLPQTPTAVSSQPQPAAQTQTIDNTARKAWAAGQINAAYSQASSIADEAGVGGEYRARANPIVQQGLSAIESIPDQQQVLIPQ